MRKNIDLEHTFEAIRQLPIDISLEQVKQWITKERQQPIRFSTKINWRFFKWFDN